MHASLSMSAYLSDFVFGGDHRHADIRLADVGDGVEVTDHEGHKIRAHVDRLGKFIADLSQIGTLKLVAKVKDQLKTVDQTLGMHSPKLHFLCRNRT